MQKATPGSNRFRLGPPYCQKNTIIIRGHRPQITMQWKQSPCNRQGDVLNKGLPALFFLHQIIVSKVLFTGFLHTVLFLTIFSFHTTDKTDLFWFYWKMCKTKKQFLSWFCLNIYISDLVMYEIRKALFFYVLFLWDSIYLDSLQLVEMWDVLCIVNLFQKIGNMHSLAIN